MMTITLPTTFAELKSAMEVYLNDYGKHLPDVVKSKSSYENYRNIMVKVLECNRNESDRPFDAAAAKILADELYNAGGARNLGESAVTMAIATPSTPSLHLIFMQFTLSVPRESFQSQHHILSALPPILIIYEGIIHEPFIRIFSTMNKAQFDSINEEYKGKRLLKDITSKMGGNFETLVLAMCADKYEYIAKRLHKLLAGSSVNREGICRYISIWLSHVFTYMLHATVNLFFPIVILSLFLRALGCISRWECTKVREAFDKGGYNRTLVTALKSSLKGARYL